MDFFKFEANFEDLTDIIIDEADWFEDTIRQDTIESQRETHTIHLVRAEREPGKVLANSDGLRIEDALYYKYQQVIEFIWNFADTYGGQIYRIAMVRLPPEKQVYPHYDGGTYYANKDRFHYVISGSYEMHVEEDFRIFNPGDLWWFDNKKIHHVKNISNTNRVAIIFDIKDSNWRQLASKR